MKEENDALSKQLDLPGGLYPPVDLEDGIMAAVRAEAEVRTKVKRLRRRGGFFFILFLLLTGAAFLLTQKGASLNAGTDPMFVGVVVLVALLLFLQLETGWSNRRPTE